jgi:soluble lytic murein transglycosylase
LFRLLRVQLFILFSFLVFSCASNSRQNYYYLGLLDNSGREKVKYFEKALSSRNEYIRRAAAEELAILMSHGKTLSKRTAERVRSEVRGFWADAFRIADAPDKDKAFSFLFGHENNSESFAEAKWFVLNVCRDKNIFISDRELAVIMGHHSVYSLRYNEALEYFRTFRTDNKWPDRIPDIFISYPELINDLGKAFQYTQSGGEGLTLYTQWLKDKELPFSVQYSLNFYAGRVARRMGGQNAKGIALFEQALTLAPDADQLDACIWYILDLTVTGSTNSFMEKLTQYFPDWHHASYYNDILERFLHKLVSEQDWNKVIRTYDLIKNSSAFSSRIAYARVIARAMENNYLTAADLRLAAKTLDEETVSAYAYYRVAYNVGIVSSIPSFLYRSQCADALNEPFLVLDEKTETKLKKKEYSPLLQFIMGFFENKAVDYLLPHLKELDRKLTADELRIVAKALHDEGYYAKCMEVVSSYIYKDGYSKNKLDWELLFPRPYLDLVERYAKEYSLPPSLLYGLIRSESAFRAAVISRAGAVGLMQLMPFTAKDMAEKLKREGGPDYFGDGEVVDSTNPAHNVHIGTYYYRYLHDYFDDPVLALMAYNGGQNRIRRLRNANSKLPIDLFVETVPILETRDYGKRVPAVAKIYQELYYKDSQ